MPLHRGAQSRTTVQEQCRAAHLPCDRRRVSFVTLCSVSSDLKQDSGTFYYPRYDVEKNNISSGRWVAFLQRMYDEAALSPLVDSLYEAMLDDDRWPSALSDIARAMNATLPMLFFHDTRVQAGSLGICVGVD